MDIGDYGKHASTILIYILDHGKVRIKDFSNLNISPTTYYKTLENLEKVKLIERKEVINRRKFVYITLTEKGGKLAMQLKQAQQVVQTISSEPEMSDIPEIQITQQEVGKVKNITLSDHVNMLDDHITIKVLSSEHKPLIFNIYIRKNFGDDYFRLWCQEDNSYDCWHVKAAWTYPQVQEMIMHYQDKSKVCPSCGYENPENAVYCMKCGTKLE